MALHPDFPDSPHAILDPEVRWFPADETLRGTGAAKLMPPLVAKLRREVKAFRDRGYAGASPTSRSLLTWWFREPHLLERADGRREEFRYFFAQREAVETVVYLYDAAGVQDKYDLMRFDGSGAVSAGMFDETWRRFVVKMATGSGKTKVLSLVLAWSYFHKLYEPGSALARNFLVIAPNIIVLDRLYKDFRGLRIFFADPVLPDNGFDGRNWRDDFQLRLHVQDQVRVTAPTGNVFLTNIHRVYAGDDTPPSPNDDNSMDYFLGPRPTGATTDSKVDLGAIVRDVDELAVLNDEAHHIHDDKLAWFKSIQDIHHRLLQKGGALSVQVDVTATPKHDNGAVFVQTVADYPLVEAISQNVVKHPVLPDAQSRAKLGERPSAKYTERYADYLDLGVVEWRKAAAEHAKLGKKAILFVMTDDTKNCDEVAAYLEGRYPDLEEAVLVIHTKQNGEISESASGKKKAELERLRKRANGIDEPHSPYKAIVSVLVLKEGWDVRNVTTIVGLRAYSAKSNILPEQTLGRGLRKMYAGSVEEKVSVVGTDAFMEFVESIRAEGVTLERAAMGEGARAPGPLGHRSRYRQRPEGSRRTGHRNSGAHAAHVSGIRTPRRAERRGHGAPTPAVPAVRRGGAARHRVPGHRHRGGGAYHDPRSRRRGRLSQRDRLFRPNADEGTSAGQRVRRAVRRAQIVRAHGDVRAGRRSRRPEHVMQPVGAGRDQTTDRHLHESGQRPDRT